MLKVRPLRLNRADAALVRLEASTLARRLQTMAQARLLLPHAQAIPIEHKIRELFP
jgi:hypothetical protein